MSEPVAPENTSPEKPARKPFTPRPRRRRRALAVALLFAVGFGLVGLHDAGYAMLIGWKDESSVGDPKMAVLRCTYFTGTERIINRSFRAAGDTRGKPRCPITMHMNLGPYGKDADNPYVITIPGRTIVGHPPAAGNGASEPPAPSSVPPAVTPPEPPSVPPVPSMQPPPAPPPK